MKENTFKRRSRAKYKYLRRKPLPFLISKSPTYHVSAWGRRWGIVNPDTNEGRKRSFFWSNGTNMQINCVKDLDLLIKKIDLWSRERKWINTRALRIGCNLLPFFTCGVSSIGELDQWLNLLGSWEKDYLLSSLGKGALARFTLGFDLNEESRSFWLKIILIAVHLNRATLYHRSWKHSWFDLLIYLYK